MATGHLRGVLPQLRRAALVRDEEAPSDGQLLECFVLGGDEAAFEALVRRHGPMVLSVCRRVVGHCQDAEDALQATFLVLVRKAASIHPRELVGNWLYGVAYRTALKMRATAAKRRARERPVVDLPAPNVAEEASWRELRPLLDQELRGLSAKYRAAVVLCDLEGKSRRAAARQLGWPEGTLSTRLMRGRQILARRLTRRGLTLSAGTLGLALAGQAAAADVPTLLLATTVKAATLLAAGEAATAVVTSKVTALMEGVLQAMVLTKIKTTLMVLVVVGLFGTGAGVLGRTALGGDRGGSEQTTNTPVLPWEPVVRSQLPSVGSVTRTEPLVPREEGEEGTEASVAVVLAERTELQGRGTPRRQVQGAVKEVNAGAGTITIAVGGGRGTEPTDMTLSLSKDVEVAVGSWVGRGGVLQAAKLTDLAAGTRATLLLSPDEKQVTAIVAEGPTLRGQVKAVDAAKKTLTLAAGRGREAAAEEKTYTLAANAEIALDDGRGRRFSLRAGSLADLAPGAIVSVQLSLDGKSIQTLMAEGPSYSGTIKAVDPAKKSLTLMTRPARGDDAGEEQTLTLADDAAVLIDDGKGRLLSVKQGKLADVPVGAMALVKLAVDQTQVASLRVEGPTVSGLLKGVDPDKGIVIISIPRGRTETDEKTYSVAKDVRVALDGTEVKLGDLKVQDNGPMLQLRLTLDQQAVQVIVAGQGRGR